MTTRLVIRRLWTVAAAALLAAPALGPDIAWGQTTDAALQLDEGVEGLPEEFRATAEADPETGATYARLLHYEGGISLRRPAGMQGADDLIGPNEPLVPGDEIWTGSDGRAEVQLADGSILRIDRDSRIGMLNLADLGGAYDTTTLLRLPSGSLYVNAVNFDARQRRFQVDTPSGSVFLLSEGIFRIDVNASGTTSVASFRGVAELLGDETSAIVHSGERIAAAPGNPPGEPRAFNTLRRDDFDLWAETRDGAIAAARSARGPDPSALPAPVRPYAAELSYYGSWRDTPEYGWVWVPDGLDNDWRPYYYGRWTWAPIGMVWVSSEPWGYAPYHYGRWHWAAGIGWFWAPGYLYSGAYVRWAVGPYYYGWCPIGYYGYPVVYAGLGWGPYYGWSYVHHGHIYHHHVHRHVYGYADMAKHRMHERAHYLRRSPRAHPRYNLERTGKAYYHRAQRGKDVLPREVTPTVRKASFRDRDRRAYLRRASTGDGHGQAVRAGGSRGSRPSVGRGLNKRSDAPRGLVRGRAGQGATRRIEPSRVSSKGNSPRLAPSASRRSPITGRSMNSPYTRAMPKAGRSPGVRRSPTRDGAAFKNPSRGQGRTRQPVTRGRSAPARPHGKVEQGRGSGRRSPFIMVLPDGSKKGGASKMKARSRSGSSAPKMRGRSGAGSSKQKVSRSRSSGRKAKPAPRGGKRGGGKGKGGKKK